MLVIRFLGLRANGWLDWLSVGCDRRGLAYITSERTRREPRTGVTAVLFLHHGEPRTVDDAVRYRVDRAVSYYALPPFFKQSLVGLWRKTNAEKRYEPYLKTRTRLEDAHKRQCSALEGALQKLLPELGPYKCYVGYVWTEPSISRVLDQMRNDNVSRVFVLPHYPHYWCFQSGLCVSELGKQLRLKTSGMDGRHSYVRYWGTKEEIEKEWANDKEPRMVEWSLTDRWPVHPALTETYCRLIENEVEQLPYDVRHQTGIVFCAPYARLYDAGTYRGEVAASCLRIAEALRHRYPYKIAWFNSWTQWPMPMPRSGLTKTLSSFVHSGRPNILILPLPYTAPTIDTEILLRSLCSNSVLQKIGAHHARFIRTPNDDPIFVHGLAEIVKNHYLGGSRSSAQFSVQCQKCVWPACYQCRRIFGSRSIFDLQLAK